MAYAKVLNGKVGDRARVLQTKHKIRRQYSRGSQHKYEKGRPATNIGFRDVLASPEDFSVSADHRRSPC